jgi:hypothetical protein
MDSMIICYIFVIVEITVRTAAVSLAALLMMRSVVTRLIPDSAVTKFGLLIHITDMLVIPTRHILPERVCTRRIDYAPLVSAIIILLVGLGFEYLLLSFASYNFNAF